MYKSQRTRENCRPHLTWMLRPRVSTLNTPMCTFFEDPRDSIKNMSWPLVALYTKASSLAWAIPLLVSTTSQCGQIWWLIKPLQYLLLYEWRTIVIRSFSLLIWSNMTQEFSISPAPASALQAWYHSLETPLAFWIHTSYLFTSLETCYRGQTWSLSGLWVPIYCPWYPFHSSKIVWN